MQITPLFLPSVGPLEMGFIFIVVMLIFGPKRLPEVLRSLGDGVRQFKDAANPVISPPSSPEKQGEKKEADSAIAP
jgi:sec-independent protein translocase protein TatA